MKRIMVIVNPASGGGRGLRFKEDLGRLCQWILSRKGVSLEIFLSSESGEKSIFNLASLAREGGYQGVIVVGGDGSVSLAAQALAGSGIPLGIIPTGSGNDFSKALRIPQEPMKALETALFGSEIEIDAGLINSERIFVNAVSFGFDAKVAQKALNLKRRYHFLPGSWLYLVALFYQLFSPLEYPEINLAVRNRGEEAFLSGKTLLLAISNGPQYGGMFKVCPQAELDDGLLDVCWIQQMSRWRIIWNFLKVIKGRHGSLPEVRMLSAESVLLFSSEDLDCQVDGEVLSSGDFFQVFVLPGMIKVRVPFVSESLEEQERSVLEAFFERRQGERERVYSP